MGNAGLFLVYNQICLFSRKEPIGITNIIRMEHDCSATVEVHQTVVQSRHRLCHQSAWSPPPRSEAKPLEELGVALPVLGHLDMEVQGGLLPQGAVDGSPQLLLDPDQVFGTTADDDGLLGVPLHID